MKKIVPNEQTVSEWARTLGVHSDTVIRRLRKVGDAFQRRTLFKKRHPGGFEYYAFEPDVVVAFPQFAATLVENRKLFEISKELAEHKVAIASLTHGIGQALKAIAELKQANASAAQRRTG